MRLYYSPGTCSLASHIVAREAGIPVDLVKVDLAAKTTGAGEDYRSINPKGSIPALLLDDGSVLTEGAVISQFIADMAPEAGLLPPAGTMARYRALEWSNFVATELHMGFGPLWRKETPPEMRVLVKDMFGMKFAYLDRHLTGRDFLFDGGFCIADAYAFTILSWARVIGIDLAKWPSLTAYVARFSLRPNVRGALAAEGLISTVAA
jgi:glutathione S-transferase